MTTANIVVAVIVLALGFFLLMPLLVRLFVWIVRAIGKVGRAIGAFIYNIFSPNGAA